MQWSTHSYCKQLTSLYPCYLLQHWTWKADATCAIKIVAKLSFWWYFVQPISQYKAARKTRLTNDLLLSVFKVPHHKLHSKALKLCVSIQFSLSCFSSFNWSTNCELNSLPMTSWIGHSSSIGTTTAGSHAATAPILVCWHHFLVLFASIPLHACYFLLRAHYGVLPKLHWWWYQVPWQFWELVWECAKWS